MLAAGLRVARDRAAAFDELLQPLNQAVEQIEKARMGSDADTLRSLTAARLRYATWLHHLLFNRPARSALFFVAARSDWLWRALFSRTR